MSARGLRAHLGDRGAAQVTDLAALAFAPPVPLSWTPRPGAARPFRDRRGINSRLAPTAFPACGRVADILFVARWRVPNALTSLGSRGYAGGLRSPRDVGKPTRNQPVGTIEHHKTMNVRASTLKKAWI